MYNRLSDLNPDIPDDYHALLDGEQYDELIDRMHADFAEFSPRLSPFNRMRQRVYVIGAVALCRVLKITKGHRD